MYFEDLSNYRYLLNRPISDVLNVGWMDSAHPYPTGDVDATFVAKLEGLILSRDPFDAHVNRMRGAHECAIGSCGVITVGPRNTWLGASEIWVPALRQGTYFAAPSLVLHYVRDHRYLPPAEFVRAVDGVDLSMQYNAQDVYDRMMVLAHSRA